jgi:tRNA G18 (ribose-2'-O)-methylase SpoU
MDNIINNFNVKDEYKNMSIDKLKTIYELNKNNAIVMCLNPDMDRNIGSIIRTASGNYFQKMVIIGRRKVDLKSAVGMNHYMPIEYVKATKGTYNDEYDFDIIIDYLVNLSNTHIIVMIEQHLSKINLNHMNVHINKSGKPPAFLLGNEGKGIPPEILNNVLIDKIIVEIPLYGLVRSYNVSNSFAMVYWEYMRMHLVA